MFERKQIKSDDNNPFGKSTEKVVKKKCRKLPGRPVEDVMR